MKTVSIFLALINSLLAGVILFASLTSHELRTAGSSWLFIKSLASAGIIVIGVLTWLGNLFTIQPGWLVLSSLALVALGAGTLVWTLHLALTTGDMEYYLIVYGGSLMVQGGASLFDSAAEARNLAISQPK